MGGNDSAGEGAEGKGKGRMTFPIIEQSFTSTETSDSLAELSKAVDSSSTIFGCVGSNPTAVTVSCSEGRS